MLLLSPHQNMVAFGIELSFSVRNVQYYHGCDGLRANITTVQGEDGVIDEIGQTETVYHMTDINFTEKCSINFRFEKIQRLSIALQAMNSTTEVRMGTYGTSQLDLPVIIASGGTISLPIVNTSSTLEVNVRVPEYYSQLLRLCFRGSHIHSHDGLPLALYFTLTLPIGHRTILLYKSEVIKENKNPLWNSFTVPLFVLNFYNESSIQLHCYNQVVNHSDSLVGYCTTTVTQLQRGVGSFNTYMLMYSDGRRINEKTSVDLQDLQLETGVTFFDMFRNKTNLHATVGVDLTASNGNPVADSSSLHYIHPHRPSPYLKAILEVTPPLLAYMGNPARPGALGFGANVLVGNNLQLSNCFFLNGSTTDHRVTGLVELLDAYRNASLSVQPFAPTDFSEVIYFVSKFAKAETRRHLGIYFVLILLSDGGPSTASAMRRSADAIVDASPHPMSIIGIGVGDNRDFGPMKTLTSPTLKSSDGRSLVRQNYTFVEASQLEGSDILTLLSLQMMQWKNQFDSRL